MWRRPAEVHVFIVWSTARGALARILDDLEERFRILEVVEVTWTPARFSQNLTRFYGDALPPGSDKERHGGTDPFVVVIVDDERPKHRRRRLSRGWGKVNANVIDARSRYREWTGGGYRVHASENGAEADRDLVQLFGRRASEHRSHARACVDRTPRLHPHDLVGTDGWASIDELLLQLEVTSGQRLVETTDDRVTIEVEDLWWAEHVAGGRRTEDGAIEIDLAGRPVRLDLIERAAG